MTETETARTPATLRGPKLTLSPFREEHISERYLTWLNDPKVNRYLEVRFARQTRGSALGFVRSFYGGAEKYMWGVHAEDGKNHIGTATLYHIDRVHGSCELGLLIGEKAYWGKNTAVEAIGLLVDHAFGPLGLCRMTGGTYAPHHGMNFLYKNLGFRREATLVKAYLLDGEYVDGYRWAILADEWRARAS